MRDNNKILGVIGGLGPMATAYFLELTIKMSEVRIEQEHLNSIIYNAPYIPDRTDYIRGKSKKNPLPKIMDIANDLVKQGADFIAMPCITAHYFYREINEEIAVPVLNIVKETVEYLKEENIASVGIMATDGTISTALFQKELDKNFIKWYLPDKEFQKNTMELIYDDIKSNGDVDLEKFYKVEKHLREKGADVIILGCTELSLIKRDFKIKGNYLDALEVLAMKSLEMGNVKISKKYEKLIG